MSHEYTLAQLRDGSGFSPDARFVQVTPSYPDEQFQDDLWAARMRGMRWSEIRAIVDAAETEEAEYHYQERLDREAYGDPDEAYDNARLGERGLLG